MLAESPSSSAHPLGNHLKPFNQSVVFPRHGYSKSTAETRPGAHPCGALAAGWERRTSLSPKTSYRWDVHHYSPVREITGRRDTRPFAQSLREQIIAKAKAV
jgi:hypothetical protein